MKERSPTLLKKGVLPNRHPQEYRIFHIYTTLILTNFLTFSYDKTIIEETKRALTITQIYHLDIFQKHTLVFVLIQLINLLPDLITLKLHSFSSDDIIELPFGETLDCYSMINKSKIKKVYLEEINDMADFDTIQTFCPHMIYFKVKRIDNMDIQLFLPAILKKINDSGNPYLRSLCFHMPLADDQMVENLHAMIRCEQLLL